MKLLIGKSKSLIIPLNTVAISAHVSATTGGIHFACSFALYSDLSILSNRKLLNELSKSNPRNLLIASHRVSVFLPLAFQEADISSMLNAPIPVAYS